MTPRQQFLAMATVSALLALPLLALAQSAPGAPASAPPAAAPAPTATPAVDPATLQQARRATKVIGAAVYNENNQSIGEVDDIIIPREGGAPVAVLSVGGFLGIGARLVAVPYERLRMNAQERLVLPGATKDSLTALPAFSYDSTTRG